MKLKADVKSVTTLKNQTAELLRQVSEEGRTLIITQNGEAKAVVMDVQAYDALRDALALLKLIAHSQADIEAGAVLSQEEAFARAREAIESRPR